MKSNQLRISLMLIISLISTAFYAQDWANLKHYQAENDSIMKAPDRNRVVFMGNSITQGWKETHPDFFNTGTGNICRGIGGQTTPQMLLRFRQDVIMLKPKVVVILAGTNDIAGNTGPSTLEMILDNIKSMTELAISNNIRVVLCSVLPANDYYWRPGQEPSTKIPQLNAMIKAYAAEKRVVYLDYFSAMADEKNAMIAEYTTDGVHCTSAGYDVMEALVAPAIKKALKTKPRK